MYFFSKSLMTPSMGCLYDIRELRDFFKLLLFCPDKQAYFTSLSQSEAAFEWGSNLGPSYCCLWANNANAISGIKFASWKTVQKFLKDAIFRIKCFNMMPFLHNFIKKTKCVLCVDTDVRLFIIENKNSFFLDSE